MDLKLFASTFAIVFIAEIGDRTQLATMMLAAGNDSRMSIFLGSSLALVSTSLISVLIGAEVTKWIPEVWLRRAAGACFVAMGAVLLVGWRE